jgi:hypothetical protein
MFHRLADEAEGIVFDPVTSPLDDAERWVQWAETAASSSALSWAGNSDNTRYNLGQFWALKAANYNDDPTAWDRLDLRAMKAWAALAELGTIKDNPPAQTRYKDEARQAYAGAQAVADRLGISPGLYVKRAAESETYFAQIKASGSALDSRLSVAITDRATALLDEAGGLLGQPAWVWAVGGLALAWLLWGRK